MSMYGSAMRAARQKRGVSLKRLSELSGIDIPGVHRYETGDREPTLINLVRLADALEIGLDEYIGRDITAGRDERG